MTGRDAIKLSGRSETWLRNHQCGWCGQTLWRSLVNGGCGAIYERSAGRWATARLGDTDDWQCRPLRAPDDAFSEGDSA